MGEGGREVKRRGEKTKGREGEMEGGIEVRQRLHSLSISTLILSVSMAVLAMRIRAFSSLLGWLTPTFFSSRKPEVDKDRVGKVSKREDMRGWCQGREQNES